MKDEYGVLPLPKFDETQKDYIATAQEWCATMVMVPVNCPDTERTSIILDAMSSAAMNTITPAYYDVVLRGKLTRDTESAAMLDLIFDSRTFDVVYAFNWGGIFSAATGTVKNTTNTIASDLASVAPAVEEAYKQTLADYTK